MVSRTKRVAVLKSYAELCAYCLRPAEQVDHVIPRCQGGTDEPENLVACCFRCNVNKGTRNWLQWMAWNLWKGKGAMPVPSPHEPWRDGDPALPGSTIGIYNLGGQMLWYKDDWHLNMVES